MLPSKYLSLNWLLSNVKMTALFITKITHYLDSNKFCSDIYREYILPTLFLKSFNSTMFFKFVYEKYAISAYMNHCKYNLLMQAINSCKISHWKETLYLMLKIAKGGKILPEESN